MDATSDAVPLNNVDRIIANESALHHTERGGVVPAPTGGIDAFITTGITPEERALIGPPPVGHGLLAVVLEEGQRLRMPDLTREPRSIGFPAHHPPMHSLLAVPIVSGGRVLGNM